MRAKVLFINTREPRCGVNQYGENLFGVVCSSFRYDWYLRAPTDGVDFGAWVGLLKPDVIVYNHAPLIGGWLSRFPFKESARHHVAVYHDGHIPHEAFDAVLFSDPTMPQHANWYPIGRPIPDYEAPPMAPHTLHPRIGVNGFMGAWAILAVRQILHEFPECILRLHLPTAPYGDPSRQHAQWQENACLNLATCRPGVTVQVERDFLPREKFLDWLAHNDLNVYVRDLPPQWRGISSVLDGALAVRRPIAVNLCTAFRHVHNLNPSICIEHNDLRTILKNDIEPLKPLYTAWAPAVVRGQVEDVLDRVIGIDTRNGKE